MDFIYKYMIPKVRKKFLRFVLRLYTCVCVYLKPILYLCYYDSDTIHIFMPIAIE